LINTARQGIVDDPAVLDALNKKQLGGYLSDFLPKDPPDFEDEVTSQMAEHEQTIITPHLGASTEEAQTECARMVGEEVAEYLTMGHITEGAAYNEPSGIILKPTPGFDVRVSMYHNDQPGEVYDMSGIIKSCGINIQGGLIRTDSPTLSRLPQDGEDRDAFVAFDDLLEEGEIKPAIAVFDLDRALEPDELAKLKNIPGMFSVRQRLLDV